MKLRLMLFDVGLVSKLVDEVSMESDRTVIARTKRMKRACERRMVNELIEGENHVEDRLDCLLL